MKVFIGVDTQEVTQGGQPLGRERYLLGGDVGLPRFFRSAWSASFDR